MSLNMTVVSKINHSLAPLKPARKKIAALLYYIISAPGSFFLFFILVLFQYATS